MKQIYTWQSQQYTITTDEKLFDIIAIHSYLTHSPWAKGIGLNTVAESISNSLCFGLFCQQQQIGFARVITDGVTFGYLCDVYILNEWQQQKLGQWLMECCHNHPIMLRLRRIMLVTSTASGFYKKVDYHPIDQKNFVWQIFRPNIYQKTITQVLVD
ncbi:GNAT family N-acetyltransferase [Acinetobacter boissieri]|uniref:Acetyltransferase (GNAT) domain-containing protein n=1 Tax=Acinetobacter boissieri TaxID=1219383 RepID=A0A1G6IWU6_9GAMM|nr:GNAT family N-acetyltransferase [Acinetobacter boissieri]SDC10900.1 Acetyltransferase (GNAT) domain-containing protein [Acinetobacter boissieri]